MPPGWSFYLVAFFRYSLFPGTMSGGIHVLLSLHSLLKHLALFRSVFFVVILLAGCFEVAVYSVCLISWPVFGEVAAMCAFRRPVL